ncbi:MAG: DUF4835 family protein [Chlorobiota bacterium]
MMRLTLIIAVLLAFSSATYSQEIEANVNVNMEMLDQEYRVNVSTMEQDVENYINSTKYTDVDFEGNKIPVDISIVLSGGYNNRYNARIFIASNRYIYGQDDGKSVVMKIADDQWSFEYARGAFFNYDLNRYNEFSSLLDFYMLIVIGVDLDTYETLGGNPAYSKARRLAGVAASKDISGFDTYVQPGEFTKFSLISELTDLRYEDLRILFFEYYVDGLDMMSENKEQGLENLRNIISKMVYFKKEKMVGPSVLLQAFTDSKARELGATFEGYKDPTVFDDLKYLAPSSTTIFEQHENK